MPNRLYVLGRPLDSRTLTQSIWHIRRSEGALVRWTFRDVDEADSTQAVAREMAVRGAPEGTTVVARSQSSGTGRLGRRWVSPIGGLYMSFILRPGGIARPELFTLVTAVAVVEGVHEVTGLAPSIRWPNDVLVGGRKLGGVIAEAQAYSQEISQVIVGVGVNCNTSESEMQALRGEATSIGMELGRRIEISRVRLAILDSFSALYDRWKSGRDLGQTWRQKVATLGSDVSIKLKSEEGAFSGTARGIDDDGNLIVSRGKGTMTISAGDLEWLRERHHPIRQSTTNPSEPDRKSPPF